MDKLTMAHEYFMKHVNTDQYRHLDDEVLILWSFDYVDAMQAEAEKRESSGLPEALCEVDWNQAPRGAAAYMKLSAWDIGVWIDDLGFQVNDAPTFGFTGSHIVERPNGF